MMHGLTEATQETLAVIAALKALAPVGHRLAVNERDYGSVIGVGGSPSYRSAIVQRFGLNAVKMEHVAELAEYLFAVDPPSEGVFVERAAAEVSRWETPFDRKMTCRTCRHWGYVANDEGRCRKMIGPDDDGLALAWLVGSAAPKLATMGDFSCSYWFSKSAPPAGAA